MKKIHLSGQSVVTGADFTSKLFCDGYGRVVERMSWGFGVRVVYWIEGRAVAHYVKLFNGQYYQGSVAP